MRHEHLDARERAGGRGLEVGIDVGGHGCEVGLDCGKHALGLLGLFSGTVGRGAELLEGLLDVLALNKAFGERLHLRGLEGDDAARDIVRRLGEEVGETIALGEGLDVGDHAAVLAGSIVVLRVGLNGVDREVRLKLADGIGAKATEFGIFRLNIDGDDQESTILDGALP